MANEDIVYSIPDDSEGGTPLTVSIFGDRAHVREMVREDLESSGFEVVESADLASLLDNDERPLGEVVQVDCPLAAPECLAALSRLDFRAAEGCSQLVVSTTLDGLEDIFACLRESNPQILVNPRRTDRIIALGQVIARLPMAQVRELAEEDRVMLLRLTEQVSKIAERIELIKGISGDEESDEGALRLEAPRQSFVAAREPDSDRLVRSPRPPLPEPRLVRRIIRQRQLRGRFFDPELFADPAWDMLLDLTAARVEHTRVSVTSLCIASGVPPTTALRWIGQMTEAGLFQRVEDDSDRRRAFIALTGNAADAMARYFAELGKGAAKLV